MARLRAHASLFSSSAFATVIKGLWKVNGRVVDPSSLKGAIQRFAPRFSGYNQEDSQEFLRYLLEGLHEDVNRVATRPAPINTEIDSSLRSVEFLHLDYYFILCHVGINLGKISVSPLFSKHSILELCFATGLLKYCMSLYTLPLQIFIDRKIDPPL